MSYLVELVVKIFFGCYNKSICQNHGCHNKSISQNENCHTSLSSLLNFQSNLNIFHFCHSYQKNLMYSLLKNKKIDKKIHFSKNAEDRKHGKQGAHSSRYFFCTP